jgi:hypothetical protein
MVPTSRLELKSSSDTSIEVGHHMLQPLMLSIIVQEAEHSSRLEELAVVAAVISVVGVTEIMVGAGEDIVPLKSDAAIQLTGPRGFMSRWYSGLDPAAK